MSKKPTWQRNMRAAWRDTLVLLRQFAGPLLLFVAVLGSPEPIGRLAQANSP